MNGCKFIRAMSGIRPGKKRRPVRKLDLRTKQVRGGDLRCDRQRDKVKSGREQRQMDASLFLLWPDLI